MKIVIVTSGSRGDVQPYVALGLEMKSRGDHTVVVCTEKRMEPFVKSFTGLEYALLAGDPTAMIYGQESQELLAKGRFMKVMMASEKHNAPFVLDVLHTCKEACEGANLIVTGPLTQTATMCIAEKLRVPWVPVFLGAVWPTREFCSWAISPKPWRWKWANKKSYSLLLKALWMQEKARINKWRAEALGLRPLVGGPMRVLEGAAGSIPIPLMCTPHVVPGQARPPDYPSFVQFTGFAFVPPAKEEDIDPVLREFVAAGEPPVYLGFGSMPAPEPRKLVELAIEVIKKVGKRAVLVAGWSDLSSLVGEGEGRLPLPPELMIVPSAPHDWLLPRCCACVHHAGIGTCAAALRAGVPSVPCPVMLDQPSNALRLVEVGCAVEPVPFAKLTGQVLCDRISAACGDAAMCARAKEVAESIAQEWRGVAHAADIVLAASSPWEKLEAAGVL